MATITGNGRRLALLLAGGLLLAGCAAGPNNVAHVDAPHVAGFWLGLWHGVILPVTFLVSLFNDHVNVYDVHNNGNWYNLGFVLGVSVVFGGPSRASARRR
ncbi:MAG TPA: hypothetical protein VFD04_20485 [Actinomycetes bacterium]|jgi:hypothetical protein|nr:hypothetical protein [Actinomycetes bacterium]